MNTPRCWLESRFVQRLTLPFIVAACLVLPACSDGGVTVDDSGGLDGPVSSDGGVTVDDSGGLDGPVSSDGGVTVKDSGADAPVHNGCVHCMTEFPLPMGFDPTHLTTGPDGNIWIAGYDAIARMTTAGVVTLFPMPIKASLAFGIVAGADGNVWFTEANGGRIGRITPTGTIAEFPLAAGTTPRWLTVGPDGNFWYVTSNAVGTMTPAGVAKSFPLLAANRNPSGIVNGPDGKLWFTEQSSTSDPIDRLASITVTGTITEYTVAKSQAFYPTVGSDGNIWVAETDSSAIARFTTSGVSTQFPLPNNGQARGLVSTLDGKMWFADPTHRYAQLDPVTGNVVYYAVLDAPYELIVGPDGNLWSLVGGLGGSVAMFTL